MSVSDQFIKLISIEKLKGLKNVDIDFDNSYITAIMGANGCGKTTVLHALACVYQPLIDLNLESVNYIFSQFFLPTSQTTWQGSKFKLFYKYRNGQEVNDNVEQEYCKNQDRWTPRYEKRPNRFVSYIGIKTCTPTIELETQKSLIKYSTKTLDDLQSNKVKEYASYVMNRNYDEYYSHTSKKSKYIGVKHNDINCSSLSMGAGEQRIFYIFSVLINAPKYSLILIDEIDLLMHTDSLKRLIKTIIKIADDRKIQIIFTSHCLTVLEFEGLINIRHLYQTKQQTICFNETKPDIMFRLTGHQERLIEIFVEDDLSEAIICKIALSLGIKPYVSICKFGAAFNCFTGIAGALLNNIENIDNMLFVLDGDEYINLDEKTQMINKVLTGTDQRATELRQKAIDYITQYNLPIGTKPEKYIHQMILNLPSNIDSLEVKNIKNIAKNIVVTDDSHKYVSDIIERLGLIRDIGLSKIIDVASLSTEWPNYISSIYDWLSNKKNILKL